ncbi:3-methyl-2-oxobutanoate hydroxymethyltransferase [Paenisporosarcina cavernae]|uniref:3-methyl-2-oxobutanoate hydroxymethyltransferase n=1 Tax=Paenisporosarcina cavernae TaxID=2320858 RepID=A0A385YRN8_9BACL|nr:3-methyl-2-oxobutanoate hydroxymethyltransferase [Paenisporosarcina cavernae]AYC29409.1 3-methyl-2-oxobutanoate hydroxymethyltransferase [Paenisporosarcina cavernae]
MKSVSNFMKMKQQGEKIAMLTAYDAPTASIAEKAAMDILLVGDSLGMVVLGYDSTVPVTLEDMIHHGKAVRRGAKDTFVVVDMPFGSYHASIDTAIDNGIRLFQETGANALKIEGADEIVDVIYRLTKTGIPVVAHLGLLPQSAAVLGGYKVQGKTASAAKKLIEDAKRCEEAGAIMVVLECIPHQLAAEISKAVSIPVIGIGAGEACDGQVLVYHDTVGYGAHHIPRFVKQYSTISQTIEQALLDYVHEVKTSSFPAEEHRFSMKDDELEQLYGGNK